MKFSTHLVFMALYLVADITALKDCTFSAHRDPKNLSKSRPIFTQANLEFIYPAYGASQIKILANKAVDVTCPGGKITGITTNEETVTAQCVNGEFKVAGHTIDLNKVFCSKAPVHISIDSKSACEGKGKKYEIGFNKGKDFVKQITLCLNTRSQLAYYSKYTLSASIGAIEKNVDQPEDLFADSFYHFEDVSNSISKIYKPQSQKHTINKLLGLDSESNKYINDHVESQYILNPGLLSSNRSFIYANQQLATFHYINAVPQWKSINSGNWKATEEQIRDYANKIKLNLDIYTGPWGVTTLNHSITNQFTPLYLYTEKGPKSIPVPDLIWKTVYEPTHKKGVVIFSLNNPYKTEKQFECSKICEDVLSQLTWLKITQDKIKGYIFACALTEAQKIIKVLPHLDASGGLLN